MRSKSKQDHFSLRKLSVGVVSVVIGTTLYLGGVNSSVLADTNSSDNVTVETNSEATTDGKTAVLPKTASDNDSQKLASLANNTSINNNKTQTSTGNSQSEQVQTETAKVNKVSDKIVSTVNESKAEVTNSSTLNENNPETADLSGFDNSSYRNKLKSFRVDKKVIRTVILNKPTGPETVTMSLEIYVSPRMTPFHMPDGKAVINYIPVVMSEITTSNE